VRRGGKEVQKTEKWRREKINQMGVRRGKRPH
jgi:hypothetical protein